MLKPSSEITTSHFHSLDALRGLAALSTVVWHWPHFFFIGTKTAWGTSSSLPFYSFLRPFYNYGHIAVNLFFCLSGFIFFLLYSDKIASHKINVRDFAILRLSRLYPLHFTTLILVGVGQFLIYKLQGSYFVYPNNTTLNFFKNLFFISYSQDSFNAPIWSVCIEILLYLCFFTICYFDKKRWWHLLSLIVFGILLNRYGFKNLGLGVMLFFMGGLSCYFFRYATKMKDRVNSRFIILILMCFLGLFSELICNFSERIFELFLFSITITCLALLEDSGINFAKLSLLGKISYSSYLLHFPLQLLTYTLVLLLNLDKKIFSSPLFFISFILLLVFLSLEIYKHFEFPVQQFLRRKFITTS